VDSFAVFSPSMSPFADPFCSSGLMHTADQDVSGFTATAPFFHVVRFAELLRTLQKILAFCDLSYLILIFFLGTGL